MQLPSIPRDRPRPGQMPLAAQAPVPSQPWGDFRLSDADRDAACDQLTRHAAAGRLTSVELDARINAVMDAQYVGQLALVLDDLPPLQSARPNLGPKSTGRTLFEVLGTTVAACAACCLVLMMIVLAGNTREAFVAAALATFATAVISTAVAYWVTQYRGRALGTQPRQSLHW